MQDRITEKVVGVVEPSLRQSEIERSRRKPPENLDAYDLYLRPYRTSLPTCRRTPNGMEFLEEALKIDANYAPAHAYLAWGLEMRVVRGGLMWSTLKPAFAMRGRP